MTTRSTILALCAGAILLLPSLASAVDGFPTVCTPTGDGVGVLSTQNYTAVRNDNAGYGASINSGLARGGLNLGQNLCGSLAGLALCPSWLAGGRRRRCIGLVATLASGGQWRSGAGVKVVTSTFTTALKESTCRVLLCARAHHHGPSRRSPSSAASWSHRPLRHC